MAKKMNKTNNTLSFICQLLQNGIIIEQREFPIRRGLKVSIGGHSRSTIRIPIAHLIDKKVEILKVDKSGNHLKTPKSFIGFAKNNGEKVKFEEKAVELDLGKGDFGVLQFEQHQLLFRIGMTRKPDLPVKSRQKEFIASPTTFLFQSNSEIFALIGGITAAAVLTLGFWIGLTKREYYKPKTIEDLGEGMQLPFISDTHFDQAPELLQQKIDRFHLIRSVTQFVTNTTDTLITGSSQDPSYLLTSTADMYKQAHSENRKRVDALLENQKKTAHAILKKPLQGVIVIPSIIGESLDGSILRVSDKFDLMRSAAIENLALKKKMMAEFPDDAPYDYATGTQPTGVNKSALEALSKINVFKHSTDEEAMYLEAARMAALAKVYRAKATNSTSNFLSPNTWDPIEVPADLAGVMVSALDMIQKSEQKIKQLKAIRFESGVKPTAAKAVSMLSPKMDTIQEPMIGEIEPQLVERTVAQNRYQLQICFELALRRNQNAGGTMEWRWTINSRGQVSELSLVNTTIADRQMADCVKSKMSNWRFPKPRRGSVEVRYPFEFSRG